MLLLFASRVSCQAEVTPPTRNESTHVEQEERERRARELEGKEISRATRGERKNRYGYQKRKRRLSRPELYVNDKHAPRTTTQKDRRMIALKKTLPIRSRSVACVQAAMC